MKENLTLESLLEGKTSFLTHPVPPKCLQNLQKSIGSLPHQLINLYEISNGLNCDHWRILPVYDENHPKKTWDSINRANSNNSKFSPDHDFLKKIIIFAEIDGNHCVFYDRHDLSIWFEDDNRYIQTNLDLVEFIKGMFEENDESLILNSSST